MANANLISQISKSSLNHSCVFYPLKYKIHVVYVNIFPRTKDEDVTKTYVRKESFNTHQMNRDSLKIKLKIKIKKKKKKP